MVRIVNNVYVLDAIPFQLNTDDVLKHHPRVLDIQNTNIVTQLIEQVSPLARPKVLFMVAGALGSKGNTVRIGGVDFVSYLLKGCLKNVKEVYPFVITCGTEVETIRAKGDIVNRYWLYEIKRKILEYTTRYLEDYLTKNYTNSNISRLCPGDVPHWSVAQQRKLFSLLGDVEGLIGVKLTDSGMMVPETSLSGIYFPAKVRFESCQLCLKEKCFERKSPYDTGLVARLSGGD